MAHQQNLVVSRESEEFLGSVVSGIRGLLGEAESEVEGEDLIGGAGEGEFEDEFAYEAEDELEGEYEGEFEDELEALYEDEGEEFLGGIGKLVGGLLGGAGDGELEQEYEDEFEDEGEEFFRGLMRRVGPLLRKAAPVLRTIAKTAGPLVATAVGGPLAGMAARALASQLEGEFEDESDAELEADHRAVVSRPLVATECEAEAMAAMAAQAATEAEAEALAGAAAVTVLSPRDRRALVRVLPGLVRGSAIITRLLYGTNDAKQFVRAVPTIVQDTARTLTRQVADGEPVSPTHAGRVMARHATRVLGSHARCRHALARNVAGARVYARRHATRDRWLPGSIQSTPVRTRIAGHVGAGTDRRGGTMRVVTPVRVPARHGQPARTVRVVTDVRVPRGAVPARHASVTRVPRTR